MRDALKKLVEELRAAKSWQPPHPYWRVALQIEDILSAETPEQAARERLCVDEARQLREELKKMARELREEAKEPALKEMSNALLLETVALQIEDTLSAETPEQAPPSIDTVDDPEAPPVWVPAPDAELTNLRAELVLVNDRANTMQARAESAESVFEQWKERLSRFLDRFSFADIGDAECRVSRLVESKANHDVELADEVAKALRALEGVYRGSLAEAERRYNDGLNRIAELESELAAEKARAERAEENYRFMVERAADQKLDGYRELGQRCADLEQRCARLTEAARVVLDELEGDHWPDPAQRQRLRAALDRADGKEPTT